MSSDCQSCGMPLKKDPERGMSISTDPDTGPIVSRSGASTIVTARLDLVVATADCLRAEMAGHAELGRILAATVPGDWPPELFDRSVIDFSLARLTEAPEEAQWWMRYVVPRQLNTVIGIAAFKGPPDAAQSVEIGYSLLPKFQKKGFATEAVSGLVARAFADERVVCVRAQTLPQLHASIRVLDRAGFRFVGNGVEDGIKTVQYELTRDAHEEK